MIINFDDLKNIVKNLEGIYPDQNPKIFFEDSDLNSYNISKQYTLGYIGIGIDDDGEEVEFFCEDLKEFDDLKEENNIDFDKTKIIKAIRFNIES